MAKAKYRIVLTTGDEVTVEADLQDTATHDGEEWLLLATGESVQQAEAVFAAPYSRVAFYERSVIG
jgi:hypothetical protein